MSGYLAEKTTFHLKSRRYQWRLFFIAGEISHPKAELAPVHLLFTMSGLWFGSEAWY
jgi:hypothetical protein